MPAIDNGNQWSTFQSNPSVHIPKEDRRRTMAVIGKIGMTGANRHLIWRDIKVTGHCHMVTTDSHSGQRGS